MKKAVIIVIVLIIIGIGIAAGTFSGNSKNISDFEKNIDTSSNPSEGNTVTLELSDSVKMIGP